MTVPNYNLIPTSSFEPSQNCFESVYEGVNEEEKDLYLNAVEADGYLLYSKRVIDGNEFWVYTKEERGLTVMWLPIFKELRVILEDLPKNALPPREEDNRWESVGCNTYFSQVGLNYRQGYLEGILDIARLEDGSFIIVDGGHNLPENADRIYNLLKKDSPDPERIVIAAWIFSHGHEDHIGFFSDFAEKYNDKVTVERFIYNFPTESICEKYGEGAHWFNAVESAISKCFADSPKVCAHPGQVFYLRNAKLTILYTHELYAPKRIDWFNTTSLVFAVELSGKKVFLPTDAGEAVADLMTWLYTRKTFSADILQIGHHGIVNTPYTLYPLVDPTYVLWPMGVGPRSVRYFPNGDKHPDCSIYFTQPFNHFIWKSRKCRHHVYTANDDIYVLTVEDGQISVSFYDNDKDYLNNNKLKGFLS